ncbi:MAG: hypothetical protein IJ689_07270 [Alphaproteobacteria bacterium]|nr:hypothetical protein [Alphaproteobacteria bacterium]
MERYCDQGIFTANAPDHNNDYFSISPTSLTLGNITISHFAILTGNGGNDYDVDARLSHSNGAPAEDDYTFDDITITYHSEL